MSEHEKGQVAASAAEIYEQFYIPAIFGEWPPRLLDAAEVAPGHRVLDVACGTGVLAREAQSRVGKTGTVVGLDINEGMLAVARSKAGEITWKTGNAENLPYATDSFDRVFCQFGLMFFEDRVKAISEMLRVVRPGGRIGVAVWAPLKETPGYAIVAEILRELFGEEAAKSMEFPFCLGDIDVLRSLFDKAGAREISLQTLNGKTRFDSLDSWIYTDIRGWTLADIIDDEGYQRFKRQAPERLSQFVLADGAVEFRAPAHIVTVTT